MKITAIIKPTNECNFACRYCYTEDTAEKGRMNHKTLQKTVEQLASLPEKDGIKFIWHGGEPLLMGIDFYKEAIEIQRQVIKGKTVQNSIQTNASLISEEFLDFCAENDFSIGTSMDGPEDIHNLTRIYPDGRGTFQDVWKGIRMIKQRKRLGGGAIVVLSRKNINALEQVYSFFKEYGISFKVNPLINSGRANKHLNDLSIGPAEYGLALVNLFNQWFYEKEDGVDVDPLSGILGSLMTQIPQTCSFGGSCRKDFISIGPQGDVYPCGRFDGVQKYLLGNLTEQNLTEILNSSQNLIMLKRGSETVTGCSSCTHKNLCNAGCMHNAYMKKGEIFDKDYYCASYKILFSHLEKALMNELEEARVA